MTTTGKGRSLTRDEIADALDWLDPSCGREDWIRIGASVKAAGEDLGEDLFEVWRAWSERGDGYNAKTIASDWRALLRGRSEKSISAGTLVYLAKAKGWIDPRKEKVDLAGAATNPRRKPPAEMVETDPDAIAAARQKVAKTLERDGFRIVAEYRYADDFFVLRLENGKGAKTLRPLSFDGYEWSPKAPDGLRPLYNLEEIVAADPKEMVFVVEGEKCADYAKSIGLVATTSSNGYQSAGRTDWSPLRGRSVCILPDRDAAGETYAMAVEKTLRGLDCEIRVARLASNRQRETPVGFDLADWIDEAEETESQTLAAAVRDLATKSTIVVRREGASLLDDLEGFEKSLAETHGVEFIGLPCGCFPRLDAMLDGWQGLGVLAAEPGLGKTTLLLQAGLGIVTANEDAAFVFLSLEMGRGAMLRRLVCQATRIPYRTLRKGDPNEGEGEGGLRLSDRDRDRLRVGLKNLRDLAPRIAIVDSEDMGRGLGVEEFGDRLVQRVEAFKARAGCGRAFVLVDHLGRLPSGSQSNLSSLERDDARISTLLAAQRRLGSDPVVVVSQVRKSDYERPGLASAKGSAEVSYSPDFMLAAWKTDADDGGAAAYGVGMPTETRFEVEIVKGRDGMIRGRVPMRFIVDEHRIEEETR